MNPIYELISHADAELGKPRQWRFVATCHAVRVELDRSHGLARPRGLGAWAALAAVQIAEGVGSDVEVSLGVSRGADVGKRAYVVLDWPEPAYRCSYAFTPIEGAVDSVDDLIEDARAVYHSWCYPEG